MSSISIPTPNKTKLTPLNLTSQTVYQILKQAPKAFQTNPKLYPTVKYATQEIRSTTDIKNNIFRKIKQLQRINSQNKRPKIKPNICRTQVSQIQDKSKKINNSTQKINKASNTEEQLANLKLDNKKFNAIEKSSAEKYYEKINKIKNLKLKQYMRNKFAIDIKTIQTARQQNFQEKDKIQNMQPLKQNFSPFKRQFLFTNVKNNNNVDFKEDTQQNTDQNKQQQKQFKKFQQKKQSDIQIRFDRIMKKTQRLQKTQVLDKIFTFTREFQQHPADVRFQRMTHQLNLFLLSFGCFVNNIPKQLPSYTRYCFKYKFFVGSGNNKNLIISLMKKRWWWVEVNTISQANFIWTQIKQSKVHEACPKSIEQPIAPKCIKFSQKLDSSTKNIRKLNQNNQKTNKLFHKKSKIKQFLDFQQKKQLKQIKQLPIKKLHNHYQGNSMLGNKKALFYYMSQYCQYKNIDRYNYIPLTFHITSSRDPQIKNLQDYINNSPNSYWLIKPGQNSNRGNGISVTKSLNQIKQKIKNLTTNTLIIQKYIDNLFLYKNRKFDIRTYMLAITIGGSTKFYWHSQGYLRTSSYIFNLQDPDNLFVHLTNDAIQSTNQNYSKYQQGNKLSYQQFQRYLDKKYTNKNYSIKNAHQQMKNIAKLAVQATYPQINISKLENSFQIFGLDFIIDSNFKPWLIQVNTNPCLQLSATCLQRLIPQMVQNAFRLSIDSIFQPCVQFPRTMSSSIPDNIFTTNKFLLIFDDFFDRDIQWQKRLQLAKNTNNNNNNNNRQYEQDQQIFQGDGQILTDL